jgi:hypothetical protein
MASNEAGEVTNIFMQPVASSLIKDPLKWDISHNTGRGAKLADSGHVSLYHLCTVVLART